MHTRTIGLMVGVMVAGTAAVMAKAPAPEAEVGQPAPDFSVTDTQGREQSLSALAGKYVVLEWFNPECPFVKKHYGSSNMQMTQKDAATKGVVWLSVQSSAKGKQGFMTPAQADTFMQAQHATPTAVILDPSGELGHLYGARTTPHLFIIDPNGTLIYNGAIDSTPSTDPSDIDGSINYVRQALDEAMAGRPVSVSSSQPYGCSVKY